jgi:hypothetical protein
MEDSDSLATKARGEAGTFIGKQPPRANRMAFVTAIRPARIAQPIF